MESNSAKRSMVDSLKLSPRDIFLLHDAFYDMGGRALQPAGEWQA